MGNHFNIESAPKSLFYHKNTKTRNAQKINFIDYYWCQGKIFISSLILLIMGVPEDIAPMGNVFKLRIKCYFEASLRSRFSSVN